MPSRIPFWQNRRNLIFFIIFLIIFLPIKTKTGVQEYQKLTVVTIEDVPELEEKEVELPLEYVIINKKNKHDLIDFDIWYGEDLSFDVVNVDYEGGFFEVIVKFLTSEGIRQVQTEKKYLDAKTAEHFKFIHDSGMNDKIRVAIEIIPSTKLVKKQIIIYKNLTTETTVTEDLPIQMTVNWFFEYKQSFGLKLF
tara:strand:+ start:1368 stop:1949 length:582 start_codon:yes stop_codon:yes gene_type:complete